MRAITIREPGGAEVLEPGDVAAPAPGPRDLLVRAEASAVNRADLLQRRGHYPAPAGWPENVPGLEYAGTVEAVGDEVRGRAPGERVMGLVGGGGYAEYVAVHERMALPVPDALSFAEAAAVPEAWITAHDALFTRLELALGERLLIHATGSGVGTAALQLARAAGATVYGTSRTDWKLERAAELGLDLAIDTSREDFAEVIRGHTEGEGVQAVLDLVGGGYLAGNLDVLAPLGRQVVVGLVSGRSAELDLGTLLSKRLTLVGTALRSRPLEQKIEATRAFERHALPLLAAGRVRPVMDRTFAMEEAGEAHRYVEGNENFGKVVLRWGE